jgi:dihydroorotate dehydrogenase
MPDLYPLARPFFWLLPTEKAHKAALYALRAGLGCLASGERPGQPNDPSLGQTLWGLEFSNPIGIAAGFDKDARVPDALLKCGFGSVEVGTVTPRPQRGNPGRRLFRLDQDEAIINRMGFPSDGFDVVAKRLKGRKKAAGVLGVNIGRNRNTTLAVSDYVEGIRRMASLADYLVVNISSPNTPGLRDLQKREPLLALMTELIKTRNETGHDLPMLIKIAPDLSEQERSDIAAVALTLAVDGIVIANTTVTRPQDLKSPQAGEEGGLSGRQLFQMSTDLLFDMYSLTSGQIPLVGVGGVFSAETAYAKIRAGASLVQVHSALIFAGLALVTRIKDGLVRLLHADGFANIAEAVGADHKLKLDFSTSRQAALARHTGLMGGTTVHPRTLSNLTAATARQISAA